MTDATKFTYIGLDGNCEGGKYLVSDLDGSETMYIRADLVPQWQPIETSRPPDGTEVLVIYHADYGEQGCVTDGPYTAEYRMGKWWASWDKSPVIDYEGYGGTEYKKPMDPTHWMPKPDAPKCANDISK